MLPLARNHCTPCTGETPRLAGAKIQELLAELPSWSLSNAGHLVRTWRFPDFDRAFRLVRSIASLAEDENHHPDVRFGWGYVEVELWTHAVDGLSANDFILAARIDELEA